MLIGTDVATPLPGLRFETNSEPKVPVIRVAPNCNNCDEDFGWSQLVARVIEVEERRPARSAAATKAAVTHNHAATL